MRFILILVVTFAIGGLAGNQLEKSAVTGWIGDTASSIAERVIGEPDEEREAALLDLVHAEVNRMRARHGLLSLRLDDALIRSAQAHSEDLAEHEYLEHTNRAGLDPTDRARAAGSPCYVSENLWQGYTYGEGNLFLTNEEIAGGSVWDWMKSPGHQRNILDGRAYKTGIGVAVKDRKVYLTQVFCALP